MRWHGKLIAQGLAERTDSKHKTVKPVATGFVRLVEGGTSSCKSGQYIDLSLPHGISLRIPVYAVC